MMGITRYFLRQLLVGMIFVSAALACILWLTQSLRLVELIVSQGISIGTFLRLTLTLMPSFLVVIIPVALFAVVLFTYNKLGTDRELVVMRAAGLSNWQLARPAVILALAATLGCYAFSLWVIPATVQRFREMQWSIRNDLSGVLLQEGSFNKFGSGITIYVRERAPDGELLGILVHDRRNQARPVTLMAERGALVFTPAGPRVYMVNGNRQQLPEGTGQLSVLDFDSYTIELGGDGGGNGPRFRDAREKSLGELWQAREEDLGGADYRRAQVELHQRLTSPLNALGLTMIALAALLSGGFDRRGQSSAILTAVGAMVAVEALTLGVANLATAKLAFLPLLYVFALTPPVLCLWVLTHPPRHRRSAALSPA